MSSPINNHNKATTLHTKTGGSSSVTKSPSIPINARKLTRGQQSKQRLPVSSSTINYSSQGRLTAQSNKRILRKRINQQISGNLLNCDGGIDAFTSVRSSLISPITVRDPPNQQHLNTIATKNANQHISKSSLMLAHDHRRQQTLIDEHPQSNANYQLTNIQIGGSLERNHAQNQGPSDRVKYQNDVKPNNRISNRPRKLVRNGVSQNSKRKKQL